jgi:septum formation protein
MLSAEKRANGCLDDDSLFVSTAGASESRWQIGPEKPSINGMKIVLASESPSRRRALDILGLTYEISPSRIDEKAIRHNDARELVRLLAEAKARSKANLGPGMIVIAGDAVVSKSQKIFEKPLDLVQAQEFLHEFSGSRIEYVTAITIANSTTGKLVTDVQLSRIFFRTLRAEEIADYVRRYNVLACAGAIEADGVARFSQFISGSCNYETGFSINELVQMLRQEGVAV